MGSINSEAAGSSGGLGEKIKNALSQINVKLVALLLVTVFVATANRVSFKVMTNALDFHPGYLYVALVSCFSSRAAPRANYTLGLHYYVRNLILSLLFP